MCVFQHGERGISIHSLRMEGDMRSSICGGTRKNFNPLPPHGGRLQKDVNNYVFRFISIHSLRMEGDNTPYIFSKASFAFQSTPSAWRETYAFAIKPHAYDVFQSTPSAWRETPVEHYFSIRNSFQSTPSAWRETRAFDDSIIAQYISIHSLRMEGD